MQLTWAGLCRLDECFPKWDSRCEGTRTKWQVAVVPEVGCSLCVVSSRREALRLPART